MAKLPITALEVIANSNLSLKFSGDTRLRVYEENERTIIGPEGDGFLGITMEPPRINVPEPQCIAFSTDIPGVIKCRINDDDYLIHQTAETLPSSGNYASIDTISYQGRVKELKGF